MPTLVFHTLHQRIPFLVLLTGIIQALTGLLLLVYYEPSARPVVEISAQHLSAQRSPSYQTSTLLQPAHQTHAAVLLVVERTVQMPSKESSRAPARAPEGWRYKRGDLVPVMVSTGTLTVLTQRAEQRRDSNADSVLTTAQQPSWSASESATEAWSQRGHICTPLQSFYAISSFGATGTSSSKLPHTLQDHRAHSDSLLAASRLVTDATGKAVLLSPAYISSHFVVQTAPNGQLLRAMHARATDFTLALLYLWAILAVLTKAYCSISLSVWMLSIVFGSLVLIAAWSGSVLPWNVHAYVAADLVSTTVEHGLRAVGLAALGIPLAAVLRGAPVVVAESLTRAFAAHLTSAALGSLFAVLIVFVVAKKVGLSGGFVDWLRTLQSRHFVPHHWQYAVISIVTVVLAVAAAGHFIPPEASLSFAERLPADITGVIVAPETTRPAWYFLPLYGLFAWLPSSAAMLTVIMSTLYIALLPVIERIACQRAPRRVASTSVGACVTAFINTALVIGTLALLIAGLM